MSSLPSNLSKDPFEILGLPRQFEVDLQELDQLYFQLQRLHHPDRLKNKNETSLNSIDINWAYGILKNPLNRAKFLLNMSGEISTLHDPKLLVESMEDRETLASLDVLEKLQNFESEKKINFNKLMNDLKFSFSKENIHGARSILLSLIYLDKLIKEIGEKIRNAS